MEPWYKVATPRKEVREGRSFNPDEFAIHLEQVIARTAPEDYREPDKFLREHVSLGHCANMPEWFLEGFRAKQRIQPP